LTSDIYYVLFKKTLMKNKHISSFFKLSLLIFIVCSTVLAASLFGREIPINFLILNQVLFSFFLMFWLIVGAVFSGTVNTLKNYEEMKYLVWLMTILILIKSGVNSYGTYLAIRDIPKFSKLSILELHELTFSDNLIMISVIYWICYYIGFQRRKSA